MLPSHAIDLARSVCTHAVAARARSVARAETVPTQVEAKILDLYDSNKLFNRANYKDVRAAFSRLFVAQNEDTIKSAYGDDYDVLTKYLDAHVELKENFYTAIDPKNDDVRQALMLFKEIWKEFPDKLDKWGNPPRDHAVAVVWDKPGIMDVYDYTQHQRRTKSLHAPRSQLGALENFRYLVDNEKKLVQPTHFYPWEFLTFVVDHRTPLPRNGPGRSSTTPGRQEPEGSELAPGCALRQGHAEGGTDQQHDAVAEDRGQGIHAGQHPAIRRRLRQPGRLRRTRGEERRRSGCLVLGRIGASRLACLVDARPYRQRDQGRDQVHVIVRWPLPGVRTGRLLHRSRQGSADRKGNPRSRSRAASLDRRQRPDREAALRSPRAGVSDCARKAEPRRQAEARLRRQGDEGEQVRRVRLVAPCRHGRQEGIGRRPEEDGPRLREVAGAQLSPAYPDFIGRVFDPMVEVGAVGDGREGKKRCTTR